MVQCTVDELKSLSPLAEVPNDQLKWLLDNGKCRKMAVGEMMFDIGDTFTSSNFILEGKFSVFMQQGKQINEVLITERGDINGYLPFSRGIVSIIRIVCIKEALLLEVPTGKIIEVTKLHYELTAALVHTMLSRVRFAANQQQQVEKMIALGKLSAGLAHELNNPAAAIGRNASSLAKLFDNIPDLFKQTADLKFNTDAAQLFQKSLHFILSREHRQKLSVLEKSDKEDELASWLEDHGIDDYSLPEILVYEGFELADLEMLSKIPSSEAMVAVFKWLSYHLTTGKIVKEIEEASKRISELVGAVKSFSHMDRGGDKQYINVHIGLESTLTLLDYKIKTGYISVIRDFSADLPDVLASAGELNQVWTNLIDNAVDAMTGTGSGILTINTKQERNNLTVTINDNGPGVPKEISSMIYDPFFTTKGIGKGTGLGLDVVMRIVNQHKGTINLKSVPGNTSFIVCIPINEI